MQGAGGIRPWNLSYMAVMLNVAGIILGLVKEIVLADGVARITGKDL